MRHYLTTRHILFAVISLLASLPRSAVAQVPTYTVTDLGSFTSGDPAQYVAYSINAAGDVAGSGGYSSFLWKNGVMTNLGGSDSSPIDANGVNGSDRIVGQWGPSQNNQAFIWQDGTLTGLGNFGGSYSTARGINDAGQVAIEVVTYTNQQYSYSAYLWQNGQATNLGSLNGAGAVAYAINASGDVVGTSGIPSSYEAFLWQNGTMSDLGEGVALGLNNATGVVGFDWYGGNPQATMWENGTATNLGTLYGGPVSFAQGINNSGQVVGGAYYYPLGNDAIESAAFLWQNGAMYDLNTLVQGNSWQLQYAYAINDNGQIVGTGQHNGYMRAFLLTPAYLQSVAVYPDPVKGGKTATGIVMLYNPAPLGGLTVTLSSNNPFAKVPVSVAIPAGSLSATFKVKTKKVKQTTTATIIATANGVSQSAALTITH